MSDSYDPGDPSGLGIMPGDLSQTTDKARASTNALGLSAMQFAGAMTKAFAQATTGGKQFDDVLKNLAMRLSNMAVANAFRPIAKGLLGSLNGVLGGITGGSGGNDTPTVTPFAAGGVIGAPGYFPLASSGFGLAGEAGPEAIVPLARGSDGRLGISMAGGGASSTIHVQIATPDAASFRRSEAYVTGQIARAVARGQRGF
jgi:phage-related minor tail protein